MMIELGKRNVFLTKVWGYDPEIYPFLGFSSDGRRSSYLNEANREDLLILVGTKKKPTAEEDQGRLLGIVELGKDILDSVQVLREIGTEIDPAHIINGAYKWPFGLPFLDAYSFIDKPDCRDVFGSYLQGLYWATNAVKISTHDEINDDKNFDREQIRQLLNFKLAKANIHEIPSLKKAKKFSENVGGGVTGPGPSASRSGSDRKMGLGIAYALKLVGRENGAFKVGYTSDIEARLQKLNKEIRPSVTNCRWELLFIHKFNEEKLAYNFEQLIHKHFSKNRFLGEQEIFKSNEKELQIIWGNVLAEKKWISD